MDPYLSGVAYSCKQINQWDKNMLSRVTPLNYNFAPHNETLNPTMNVT